MLLGLLVFIGVVLAAPVVDRIHKRTNCDAVIVVGTLAGMGLVVLAAMLIVRDCCYTLG